MKRAFLSIATVLSLAAFAQAPKAVDVDAFAPKAKAFDKKVVAVSGTVAKFKARESKAGNKYTTFMLEGKKDKVNVYLRGYLAKPPKDGDKVIVTGTYRLEKEVAGRKFKNEIEATEAKGKPFGVRPMGKAASAKK
jgi:aspartate 1-decarboxylase